MQRMKKMTRVAAAAVLGTVLASGGVALTAAPAQASGTATAPGWYGGQPMTLDQCSTPRQLAVGSDRKPMRGWVCITKTGYNRAQAVVVFDNSSASSATAVATVQARGHDTYDNVVNGTQYTCGGKTLKPYTRLYCAGYNTSFSGGSGYWSGFGQGTFTVNGYGTWDNTAQIRLY